MTVAKNEPMPHMPEKFSVGNILLWGKLVKMWSTGKAYDEVPVMPQPRSLAELKRQMDKVELEYKMPEHITGLVVVNYTREALVLRVPEKSLVEDAEKFLKDKRSDYPELEIYKLFEQYEDPATGKIKKEHKLDFHAARLGDYTLAHCG